MCRHMIILGSSYETGERIALDYCDEDINKVAKKLEKMRKSTRIPLAIHILKAKSEKWEDVKKFDAFFENIKVIKTEDEFLKLLLRNKELSSLDVAEYILSKCKCSHTKLEKIAYFCYADYLCEYNEKLFNDRIYAFKYGPVIEQIYETYKYKYREEMEKAIPSLDEYNLPIKSRILISENGHRKLMSIEKTIEKYKGFSTDALVSLTHKENTPWSISNIEDEVYCEITDKEIKKFHCNESM